MTMVKENVVLGLGELGITSDLDTTLVCLGLGSCVAVSAYDPTTKVAGMAHIVLPSKGTREDDGQAKYADTGIPRLFKEMEKQGATKSRLIVKLVGGAQMSSAPGLDSMFMIGNKNVEAVQEILTNMGIAVRATETGGRRGRTARMSVATGKLVVTSVGGEGKEL